VYLTGHESTIVGRAELWRECLALHTNPIFGVGFESFWLGDRAKLLQDERFWQLNEAHNGYLETYLNLGVLGLLMLIGVIIATFRKIRLDLLRDSQWGGVELGFLVAALFHNWTESSFRGLGLVWFVFYIIAMNYPRVRLNAVEEHSELYVETEEAELVYRDRI
jgi:O-antigen ligase